MSNPPITKYLDPSSKAVDLAKLCRRLFSEWKYHDREPFPVGNFVKVFKDRNATSPHAFGVIQQFLGKLGVAITPEMKHFLEELSVTKYSVTGQDRSTLYDVAAKDFRGGEGENLKPEELLEIYWKLKMQDCCPFLTAAIEVMVKDFRKLKYKGFLLPNGKVSMNFCLFRFKPDALHLFDYYQLPKGVKVPQENLVIGGLDNFKVGVGFYSQHVVMSFNLPEKDDQGNLGRLMILDPTCAQFGMKGRNGEILYWGSFEDYVMAFPAKGFQPNIFYRDNNSNFPIFAVRMYVAELRKAILSTMNSDSCGYCGEIGRKDGKIKLKKCLRCKKTSYCDVLCQKLAWKSHKLECKAT